MAKRVSKKAIEARIQSIYNSRLSGVQIPILLLPRIYKAAEIAIAANYNDDAIGDAMVFASGTHSEGR